MKIIIEIENPNDAQSALAEVGELIEQGYTNGYIGCSSDTWEITE
jgi:hypothetical protein